MPGVPTHDLEERRESPEASPEEPAAQESPRQILEQRVAEAKRVVTLLVSTIGHLRQEAATLRAEQQHLREHMESLRKFLKQEKEAGRGGEGSGDPCARSEMAAQAPTSTGADKPSVSPASGNSGPETPPDAGSSE